MATATATGNGNDDGDRTAAAMETPFNSFTNNKPIGPSALIIV